MTPHKKGEETRLYLIPSPVYVKKEIILLLLLLCFLESPYPVLPGFLKLNLVYSVVHSGRSAAVTPGPQHG